MKKIQEKDFKEIYETTYSQILKFIVINCYDFNDVNDIIQDTYIEFLNKIKKGLEVDSIQAYLSGIAKNIIKRHYFNKKKLTLIANDDIDIEIKDDIDLEADFISQENIKEIWEYITKKDILTAKVFYLYFVSDLKILDIAKELKISESNVKHKLYRTIKELKNNFGKEVN